MVVELFGLPGSGKSYIATNLINELKEKNIKAAQNSAMKNLIERLIII